MERKPAVAGFFYPDGKTELLSMLENFVPKKEKKTTAIGIVSPHAGYIYSGNVAGAVFSEITPPQEAIILSPNHTGMGRPFSLYPGGSFWSTPLGKVEISGELTALIKNSYELVDEDTSAHHREHAAEVQLPFLQYINPKVKVACVVISPYSTASKNQLKLLQEFGLSLGEAIKKYDKRPLIIASSDMTHYESLESAKDKDFKAIKEIQSLNEEGLFEVINKYDISMCGYAPTIVMIKACKVLGAKQARLIKYATSGEVSGDFDHVVGYAGIVIE
jgi:hypothetical protein